MDIFTWKETRDRLLNLSLSLYRLLDELDMGVIPEDRGWVFLVECRERLVKAGARNKNEWSLTKLTADQPTLPQWSIPITPEFQSINYSITRDIVAYLFKIISLIHVIEARNNKNSLG